MRQPLLLGLSAGILASVVPFELVILAVPVLGLVFLIRLFWPVEMRFRSYFIGVVAALAVMTFAAWLPVKALDRKVGPMHYDAMPMERLGRALKGDWRVNFYTNSLRVVSFHVNEPASRREVLRKLARETDLELRILSCGSGASLLSGGFPCFTALNERPPKPSTPGSCLLE